MNFFKEVRFNRIRNKVFREIECGNFEKAIEIAKNGNDYDLWAFAQIKKFENSLSSGDLNGVTEVINKYGDRPNIKLYFKNRDIETVKRLFDIGYSLSDDTPFSLCSNPIFSAEAIKKYFSDIKEWKRSKFNVQTLLNLTGGDFYRYPGYSHSQVDEISKKDFADRIKKIFELYNEDKMKYNIILFNIVFGYKPMYERDYPTNLSGMIWIFKRSLGLDMREVFSKVILDYLHILFMDFVKNGNIDLKQALSEEIIDLLFGSDMSEIRKVSSVPIEKKELVWLDEISEEVELMFKGNIIHGATERVTYGNISGIFGPELDIYRAFSSGEEIRTPIEKQYFDFEERLLLHLNDYLVKKRDKIINSKGIESANKFLTHKVEQLIEKIEIPESENRGYSNYMSFTSLKELISIANIKNSKELVSNDVYYFFEKYLMVFLLCHIMINEKAEQLVIGDFDFGKFFIDELRLDTTINVYFGNINIEDLNLDRFTREEDRYLISKIRQTKYASYCYGPKEYEKLLERLDFEIFNNLVETDVRTKVIESDYARKYLGEIGRQITQESVDKLNEVTVYERTINRLKGLIREKFLAAFRKITLEDIIYHINKGHWTFFTDYFKDEGVLNRIKPPDSMESLESLYLLHRKKKIDNEELLGIIAALCKKDASLRPEVLKLSKNSSDISKEIQQLCDIEAQGPSK